MNFDTPPEPVVAEKSITKPAEQIPSGESKSLESKAHALTTEMLERAQSNREISVEKAGFTMEDLKRNYPGVFKFLRITGVIASLFMASEAAYAGGPVVRGPVVRDAIVHAAKPISHGVIREAAPINHGISHAPVVRAPGEKRMSTVIPTLNQSSPTHGLESQAKGGVRTDSNGNTVGNFKGGIDLTRG